MLHEETVKKDNSGESNNENSALSDYSMQLNEMNDHNVTSGGREELEMLCYKVPALQVEGVVLFELDLGYFNKCIL